MPFHQSIESPRRSYLCKARRVQCRERGNDWVHSFTPAQTHAFPTQSDLEYELAKDSLSSCNKACKVMLCYVGTPCCVHLFTDKAPQFGQAAFANNLKAWNSIKSTDLFCILHFAWLFYGTKRQPFLNANRSIGVRYHTDSYGVSVFPRSCTELRCSRSLSDQSALWRCLCPPALGVSMVAAGHLAVRQSFDSTMQGSQDWRKSRLSQCNSPAMTKP